MCILTHRISTDVFYIIQGGRLRKPRRTDAALPFSLKPLRRERRYLEDRNKPLCRERCYREDGNMPLSRERCYLLFQSLKKNE